MDRRDHKNLQRAVMAGTQGGMLEPFSSTTEIPAQLEHRLGLTYILLDERFQTRRVGYQVYQHLIPVVIVGHSLAIQAGDWASPEEYWGEFYTKPFKFRRAPRNPEDPNAIMVTSLRGKFLGFLTRELASILSPLADKGVCAIFGVAGHISVEIAEGAIVSREAKMYLDWIEDFLSKYQDGKAPESLPQCPVSLKDLQ